MPFETIEMSLRDVRSKSRPATQRFSPAPRLPSTDWAAGHLVCEAQGGRLRAIERAGIGRGAHDFSGLGVRYGTRHEAGLRAVCCVRCAVCTLFPRSPWCSRNDVQ